MAIRICLNGWLVVAFCLIGGLAPANEHEHELLRDVDVADTLKNEPEYQCDRPLYAVAVFGEKPNHFVWIVLDKSSDEAKTYDRAWVDINANGDLTDVDEAFGFDESEDGSIEVPELHFGDEHPAFTEFRVRLSDARSGIGMIKAVFDEELKLAGGYPVNSDKYMQFAESPDQAPVVWFKPNTPFEFQRWIERPLTIGNDTDFKVFLGWQGQGPASFCSTLGHILPEEEIVLATLQYTDTGGATQFVEAEFPDRC
ncbi:MAG: hypothetical protein ACR2NP_21315 [Pirellulaceae bacterium]